MKALPWLMWVKWISSLADRSSSRVYQITKAVEVKTSAAFLFSPIYFTILSVCLNYILYHQYRIRVQMLRIVHIWFLMILHETAYFEITWLETFMKNYCNLPLWYIQGFYRNCARKPIPSLPGFSRGMNGACVAKHIVAWISYRYNVFMSQTYRSTQTTVSLIKYHFVFCPRYRRKVLVGAVEERLKIILSEICEEIEIQILALECDKDHCHQSAHQTSWQNWKEWHQEDCDRSVHTWSIYQVCGHEAILYLPQETYRVKR